MLMVIDGWKPMPIAIITGQIIVVGMAEATQIVMLLGPLLIAQI